MLKATFYDVVSTKKGILENQGGKKGENHLYQIFADVVTGEVLVIHYVIEIKIWPLLQRWSAITFEDYRNNHIRNENLPMI